MIFDLVTTLPSVVLRDRQDRCTTVMIDNPHSIPTRQSSTRRVSPSSRLPSSRRRSSSAAPTRSGAPTVQGYAVSGTTTWSEPATKCPSTRSWIISMPSRRVPRVTFVDYELSDYRKSDLAQGSTAIRSMPCPSSPLREGIWPSTPASGSQGEYPASAVRDSDLGRSRWQGYFRPRDRQGCGVRGLPALRRRYHLKEEAA